MSSPSHIELNLYKIGPYYESGVILYVRKHYRGRDRYTLNEILIGKWKNKNKQIKEKKKKK